MSIIFILSGAMKIGGYAATAGYMQSKGVPGMLLPLVIITELGGGLLLLAGFQTRLTALALAGFTLIAAAIFHSDFGDQNQMVNFLKNLALSGGLLALFASGAGAYSLDGMMNKDA